MTDTNIFKDITYDSLNRQVDGDHYKGMTIQPAHFIYENNLNNIHIYVNINGYSAISNVNIEFLKKLYH